MLKNQIEDSFQFWKYPTNNMHTTSTLLLTAFRGNHKKVETFQTGIWKFSQGFDRISFFHLFLKMQITDLPAIKTPLYLLVADNVLNQANWLSHFSGW